MLPDSFCSQGPELTRQKEIRWQYASGSGQNARAPYAPRLKMNRYSSNSTIAPTTDMIHPAM
jgi:hypothetical protein